MLNHFKNYYYYFLQKADETSQKNKGKTNEGKEKNKSTSVGMWIAQSSTCTII